VNPDIKAEVIHRVAQDITVTTGNDTEFNAVCQNQVGSVGDVTATQAALAAAGNARRLWTTVGLLAWLTSRRKSPSSSPACA
jgi:hypothetical protein